MALNAYLHLKLDGANVQGSVTQKGREGTIEVNALEWSFDSDDNIGEVKFTSELGKEHIPITEGLREESVAEALFDFYQPTIQGQEVKVFTLHGTNGRVTSATIWLLNNKDPNLVRYDTTMQYTMSFEAFEQTWVPTGEAVTLPLA